jgi:hypothetical protein
MHHVRGSHSQTNQWIYKCLGVNKELLLLLFLGLFLDLSLLLLIFFVYHSLSWLVVGQIDSMKRLEEVAKPNNNNKNNNIWCEQALRDKINYKIPFNFVHPINITWFCCFNGYHHPWSFTPTHFEKVYHCKKQSKFSFNHM